MLIKKLTFQCATLLVFHVGRIHNICLKWYLIWISESWKHQNCLEIRRMPTCTYLIETRWQKSGVSCQKKGATPLPLYIAGEGTWFYSYGMHRLTTYHRSKLSTWRNQLSIFISITSRCNSLSLHCWCGMNWFICHLLVKKFNFDVVCIFLQMTFLQHEARFFLVDHFLSE